VKVKRHSFHIYLLIEASNQYQALSALILIENARDILCIGASGASLLVEEIKGQTPVATTIPPDQPFSAVQSL
jgi:hypothetical protein